MNILHGFPLLTAPYSRHAAHMPENLKIMYAELKETNFVEIRLVKPKIRNAPGSGRWD